MFSPHSLDKVNYCFPRFFYKIPQLLGALKAFSYLSCNYFSLHFVSSSTSLTLWDFEQTASSILDVVRSDVHTKMSPSKWLIQLVLSKQYGYKAMLNEDASVGIVIRVFILAEFAESWPRKTREGWFSPGLGPHICTWLPIALTAELKLSKHLGVFLD